MIRNRAYCQTVEPRGPLDLSYYADALHINPLRALLLQALKGLLLLIFGHPIFLEVCDLTRDSIELVERCFNPRRRENRRKM